MTKQEAVKFSLYILGEAYRSDWQWADGRQMRREFEYISSIFDMDLVPTETDIMARFDITKTEFGYGWKP